MKGKAVKRVCLCAVVFVPCQRIALACQVGAYLIFLAGIKGKLKKKMGFSTQKNFIVGAGGNSFCLVILVMWNVAYVVGVLCQRVVYKPRVFERHCFSRNFCNGMVKPFCYHGVPAVHDFFLHLFVKGKHHNAACVPVQPVNGKRPVSCRKSTPRAHDFFQKVKCGSCLASGVWNGKQTRGLVYDNNVLVFVKNFYLLAAIVCLVFALKLGACLYVVQRLAWRRIHFFLFPIIWIKTKKMPIRIIR